MSRAATRWFLLCFAVVLLVPLSSLAGLEIEAPSRWERDRVEASASRRANGWANQTGLDLDAVWANGEVDDFVETIALLSSHDPLPASFATDDAVALNKLRELAGPLVTGEPRLLEARATPDGVTRYAHGVWRNDVDVHASLFPTDTGRALLIMAARSNEAIVYDEIFGEVLASVSGTAIPEDPFPVASYKRSVWIGAGVLGLLAYLFAFVVLSQRAGDHAGAGRRAALILVGGSVIATGIVYSTLGPDEARILAAGATRTGLAGLCLGAGLLAAALTYVVGGFADREDDQKVGAPSSAVPLSVRLAQAEAERVAAESTSAGAQPQPESGPDPSPPPPPS